MEPTFDIPSALIDNGAEFVAPLFQGLSLSAARHPLAIDGKARDYLFPTLYADVRCAVGIFHCSFARAKDFLRERLGEDAQPPRMLGGRSIVAISCYEYRKVRGVRPYNEIAIAIPVRMDGKKGIPVLGAFSASPDSGYHIASMPVTSEENRLRGHHFWNLPKITRRIDILEGQGKCRFESFDEDGTTLDIALDVATSGKPRQFSVRSFLATKKDGVAQRNPTAFEGEFQVMVNVGTLWGARRGSPALGLGKGEASGLLRRIGAETVPLQTRYASSMNSWFDLPARDHLGYDEKGGKA